MTTVYDIPADLFNPALAEAMAEQKAVSMPDWGQYVKTAVDRERPPTQDNWWYLRTAAILRKVARNGPVGVTHLAQAFGGKKDNGAMPNTPGVACDTSSARLFNNLRMPGWSKKSPPKRWRALTEKCNFTQVAESRLPVRNSLITWPIPFAKKPKHSTPALPSIDHGK